MKQAQLDKIKQQLLEGLNEPSKWVKTWQCLNSQNLEGRAYSGRNILILASVQSSKGYTSNRWGTYKAIQSKGLQVRKGEKGYIVTCAKSYENVDGELKFFLGAYPVFNLDQCDGDKSQFAKELSATPSHESIDTFLESTGAQIESNHLLNPHYNPTTDKLGLPLQFNSIEEKYLTTFHELTHWTGHTSRLNRNLKDYASDIKVRAFEELIAESGAAILATQHGLTPQITENTKAYITGWISALNNDPNELLKAFSQASKAVNYINEIVKKELKIAA